MVAPGAAHAGGLSDGTAAVGGAVAAAHAARPLAHDAATPVARRRHARRRGGGRRCRRPATAPPGPLAWRTPSLRGVAPTRAAPRPTGAAALRAAADGVAAGMTAGSGEGRRAGARPGSAGRVVARGAPSATMRAPGTPPGGRGKREGVARRPRRRWPPGCGRGGRHGHRRDGHVPFVMRAAGRGAGGARRGAVTALPRAASAVGGSGRGCGPAVGGWGRGGGGRRKGRRQRGGGASARPPLVNARAEANAATPCPNQSA